MLGSLEDVSVVEGVVEEGATMEGSPEIGTGGERSANRE